MTTYFMNPNTKTLTFQSFYKVDDECFVEHYITHVDDKELSVMEHKRHKVTAEQGNDHYKALLRCGYRKLVNRAYSEYWEMLLLRSKEVNSTQSKSRCLCKRCGGYGIFFIGVENGHGKPARPDSGTCYRCHGSGYEP